MGAESIPGGSAEGKPIQARPADVTARIGERGRQRAWRARQRCDLTALWKSVLLLCTPTGRTVECVVRGMAAAAFTVTATTLRPELEPTPAGKRPLHQRLLHPDPPPNQTDYGPGAPNLARQPSSYYPISEQSHSRRLIAGLGRRAGGPPRRHPSHHVRQRGDERASTTSIRWKSWSPQPPSFRHPAEDLATLVMEEIPSAAVGSDPGAVSGRAGGATYTRHPGHEQPSRGVSASPWTCRNSRVSPVPEGLHQVTSLRLGTRGGRHITPGDLVGAFISIDGRTHLALDSPGHPSRAASPRRRPAPRVQTDPATRPARPRATTRPPPRPRGQRDGDSRGQRPRCRDLSSLPPRTAASGWTIGPGHTHRWHPGIADPGTHERTASSSSPTPRTSAATSPTRSSRRSR